MNGATVRELAGIFTLGGDSGSACSSIRVSASPNQLASKSETAPLGKKCVCAAAFGDDGKRASINGVSGAMR